MKKPLAIDLFCGAGGMSEGILQAGFHIIFSSDKSEEASLTYQKRHEQLGLINNYNTSFHTMDIKDLNGKFIKNELKKLKYFKENSLSVEKIDAIFGGPPCQGYSRAGLRKKNDPRNVLFKEYLRVISEINPNYVVLENVAGILDAKIDGFESSSGNVYSDNIYITEILESEFLKLGYKIKNYKVKDDGKVDFSKLVVNASNFGVPQKRDRVIIVAYKKNLKEPCDINNYKVKNIETIESAIGDLILDKKLCPKNFSEYIIESKKGRTKNIINNKTISSNGIIYNSDLSNHFPYIEERFSLFNEGESAKNVKDRISKNGFESLEKLKNLIEYSYSEINKKYDYSSLQEFKKDLKNIVKLSSQKKEDLLTSILSKKNIRMRLSKDEPAKTVVTLPDDYISPFENRTLSVREMARLQSFDDSFVFYGKRTTGGARRKVEVPQYTQVGNAVPPLLAKAIAKSIIDIIK